MNAGAYMFIVVIFAFWYCSWKLMSATLFYQLSNKSLMDDNDLL